MNPQDNFTRSGIQPDTQYRYVLLTSEYVERVVKVFTAAFCRAEPMTRYLQMDEAKYNAFARAVTEKAVEDGLSTVALDKDRVIAFTLAEDLANPGAIPPFDPKFDAILALLESLGGHYFQGKAFPPGHVAHLFIAAVDKEYRGQGLSTQVNFQAMDRAASKNFDFMYCEFTNSLNEKGTIPYLKNKKRLIGSQDYQHFRVGNEKPFSHLQGGANAYLWEIRHHLLLRYQKDGREITEEL